MKTFFFTLILFGYAANCSAQSPGYMGKKLSLYYSMSAFPSLQPSHTPDYYGSSSGVKFGVNLRNDFAFDYAISKSVALGVSVKFVSTSLQNAEFYTKDGYGFEPTFAGDIKLIGNTYSFYIKNFNFRKRGSIAPTGYYTKWEFMYGSVKGKTGKLRTPEYTYYDPYYYLPAFEDLGYNSARSFGGVLFSFGRQSLFFDRLFITTGATLGFVPGGLNVNIGDSYYGMQDSYTADVGYRMFGYFMINFNLGIGFLAF